MEKGELLPDELMIALVRPCYHMSCHITPEIDQPNHWHWFGANDTGEEARGGGGLPEMRLDS